MFSHFTLNMNAVTAVKRTMKKTIEMSKIKKIGEVGGRSTVSVQQLPFDATEELHCLSSPAQDKHV